MYEFDVDKASSDPSASGTDLFAKVKKYPDDFDMTSLSPSSFATLVANIASDETVAKNFINRMC